VSQLVVQDLRLRFGGLQALDGISFEVQPGELFSLIGPNGAGKTTVFNCINGIYRPDAGSIRFAGQELTGRKPDRVARAGVARTFQNIELFARMTTLDNLLLGRHLHSRVGILRGALFGPGVIRSELAHRRRVEQILDLLDLQAARHQLVGGLPYGTQKLVELGRALATEPKLLLLDEPSAGMNAEEKLDLTFRLGDIRAEYKLTILLVEHDMRMVMGISDRVLAMNEGRLIGVGRPAEVQRHPEVMRAYLGETVEEPTGDAGAA
jgi:branched-chain amino acid transport system ATP-binding protein